MPDDCTAERNVSRRLSFALPLAYYVNDPHHKQFSTNEFPNRQLAPQFTSNDTVNDYRKPVTRSSVDSIL